MGNLFDGAQSILFNTVNSVFGYNCHWVPSDNVSPSQDAQVLYKDPTKSKRINDVSYDPLCFEMEYKQGDFPGLFESVQAGNYEKVTIYNINEDISTGVLYFVKSYDTKFDGKTYLAYIEKV